MGLPHHAPPWTPPGRHPDPKELARALREAHIPTLLLTLAHLTGETRWLQPPFRPARARGLEDNDDGGLPERLQRVVRLEAQSIITAWGEGRLAAVPPPAPERIAWMLGASLGQHVPASYGTLLAEELGLISRDADIDCVEVPENFHVVVIGAGFSGICAAIKLRRAGIPFTVVDKNDGIGGTWLENTYPGCGVDTPSHLYSFSFAQRPGWSRYFARREEIYDYLRGLAAEHDLARDARFATEVTAASWDEGSARWRLRLNDSAGEHELSANVVISAVGLLNRPSVPAIPGLDRFAGPCMHTARWREDVELEGKRVAVIGTGASAMQLVPAVADVAQHVTVFQRSPQWAIPHPNYKRQVTDGVRTLMESVPYYAAWYRARLVWNFGDRLHPSLRIDPRWPHFDRSINEINDGHRRFLTAYIESELAGDPGLIAKSLPRYPPYGKRPLIDNGWFATLLRDDVALVTDRVAEVTRDCVVTSTGEQHPADVLVLATGFQTLRVLGPMEVTGRSGRRLREIWGEDDARAYLGISIPDLPNFFCIYGPNSNVGHGGSAVLSSELQVRYITALIGRMLSDGIEVVEPRQEVHDEYNAALDAELSQMIWTHPGMTTYYRNSAGRIVTNTPWTNLVYWQLLREPRIDDFTVRYAPRAAIGD